MDAVYSSLLLLFLLGCIFVKILQQYFYWFQQVNEKRLVFNEVLSFTSQPEVKGRTLIKMKLSCAICSGGLAEGEQRVDEIECKASSSSTATASCVWIRSSDAAEDCGVYFEAWRVAVGQFYKVIKEKREKERAISPHPDSAEESGQSEHNQNPSLRV